MSRVIYYIDGDNGSGKRTLGIEGLTEDSIVKIYYADNNKYYTKQTSRETLSAESKCETVFRSVRSGSNAVDMAIAVESAADLAAIKRVKGIVLVSADSHFDTIAEMLRKHFPSVAVKCALTIKQGADMTNLLTISNETELKEMLKHAYGDAVGEEIYRNLAEIILKSELKKLLGKRNAREEDNAKG